MSEDQPQKAPEPPPIGMGQQPPMSQVPQQSTAFDHLIPTKNKNALAAYYCGVFSLIVCVGLPLSVLALVFGIRGLRDVKQNPSLPGTGHAWAGIILGGVTGLIGLGIIVAIVVGMLMS